MQRDWRIAQFPEFRVLRVIKDRHEVCEAMEGGYRRHLLTLLYDVNLAQIGLLKNIVIAKFYRLSLNRLRPSPSQVNSQTAKTHRWVHCSASAKREAPRTSRASPHVTSGHFRPLTQPQTCLRR